MIIFLCKHTKKMKKVLAMALMLMTACHLILPDCTLADTQNLSMYSGSYALMDGKSGRILAGKKENEAMANASTTKILTCIVALEQGVLGDSVPISKKAASQPKVRIGVREGEVYKLEDLLYALMLESYNDCAVAIAEHIAGSTEGFARLMNEKALQLGCRDTYFITPNGLDAAVDDKFHHSTASDLCKIMAYCVWESPEKDRFLQITQTGNYSFSVEGRSFFLTNRNSFLNQMEGVLSGKTGFTSKAGYCYVAALEQNGERYCIALLACGWPNNKTYKWKDAKKLLNYGLDTYGMVQFEEELITRELTFDGAVGICDFDEINREMVLKAEGKCGKLELLLKEGEKLRKEIFMKENLELPIEKGESVGVCRIYLDEMLLQEISLLAKEEAKEWNLIEITKQIFLKFFFLGCQSEKLTI